jgi:hypothetical protein
MKLIVIMLIAAAYIFMPQEPVVELRVGATLPEKITPKEPKELTILHRRGLEMKPLLRKKIKGVKYWIAYDETSHRILQISTYDKNFVTEAGLRVGMFVEVSKEWFRRVAMGIRLGPKTKDGWYTVIGLGAKIITLRGSKKVMLKDGVDIPDDLEGARIFADGQTIMAEVVGFTRTR